MGGFGGSAAAMNQTLKFNRGQLKKRKSLKEIRKDNPVNKDKIRIYQYKKASKIQLATIRERLQSQSRRQRMLKILVLVTVAGSIVLILYRTLFM